MEAKEFDFEFPRGDTPVLSWEMTDANGKQLDISPENCEIIFTARSPSKTIVIQKSYKAKEIKVEGIIASLVLEHDDTKDLIINGTYNYDIQFNSGDYYKTLILGKIKLTNEVTY